MSENRIKHLCDPDGLRSKPPAPAAPSPWELPPAPIRTYDNLANEDSLGCLWMGLIFFAGIVVGFLMRRGP